MNSVFERTTRGPHRSRREAIGRLCRRSTSSWLRVRGLAALTSLGVVPIGCGGEPSTLVDSGQMQVRVSAVTLPGEVARVTADIQPAGLSNQELAKDAETGTFTATLLVPPGPQTITLKAFNQAGDPLGEGSATATVTAGATTGIKINIIDSTPAATRFDLPVFITDLTASKVLVAEGEQMQLKVTAIDKDGDPITYAWSDNCTTTTFGTASTATTTWSNSQQSVCMITVRAEANGTFAEETIAVSTVAANSGAIEISGDFIPRPVIQEFAFWRSNYNFCAVVRSRDSGLCPQPISLNSSEFMPLLKTTVPPFAPVTETFSDDCGGTWQFGFLWRPPARPAICKVTANISTPNGTDEMSIVVFVE